MSALFQGKSILVTGVCGTVGVELAQQLLSNPAYAPAELLGIDNNESRLFFLEHQYLQDKRAHFSIADVRDRDELTRKMAGVDVVFHCAALKHVVLCERSPEQAVQTNIGGVQNVIAAANANNVATVIFTSSDKAVNPTNVMGTSKLMGERLMTAANSNKRGNGPVFASTRFGNVLGSNGSVVPIFHNQIARGGPVTLTHRDMTRFVMSVQDSVRLIIDSALRARGGEVFITKMPVVRVADLAQAMIAELAPMYGHAVADIAVVEVGTKPGEKLYEELMSPEEIRRAVELEHYFAVLPAFRGIYREISYDFPDRVATEPHNPYVSANEPALDVSATRKLLRDFGLLAMPSERMAARYWPGDKGE